MSFSAALSSVSACAIALAMAGCAGASRLELASATGGSAALFGQFQAYDGRTGRPLGFAELVRRCAAADVILFGEQHGDAVCNQLEAQIFLALGQQRRPIALALEFFEVDTQAALDAYLAGRIDEPAFRQQTRQKEAYALSHRPLIELCRAAKIPVLAANAPRRLVRDYRTSGLDYPAYRASRDPEEQRWLPAHCEHLSGPYEARFTETMREHRATDAPPSPAGSPASEPASQPATATAPIAEADSQPSAEPRVGEQAASQPAATQPSGISVEALYRAQLLWDEAMAASLADFRDRFSTHRVMLIVGSFHVAHEGGTVAKLRRRRPDDRVAVLVYRATSDGRLPFQEADRHAGDVLIYGIAPPPKAPSETASPTTMPASDDQQSG